MEELLNIIFTRVNLMEVQALFKVTGQEEILDKNNKLPFEGIFNDTIIRLNNFADERELTKNNKMQINKYFKKVPNLLRTAGILNCMKEEKIKLLLNEIVQLIYNIPKRNEINRKENIFQDLKPKGE